MSKEQNKNYGKSIRTKLLNVAKKENIFYQTILTRMGHRTKRIEWGRGEKR